MDETTANPIYLAVMFVLRCLVPLAIMLGISYLLRRLGLIAEQPKENNRNNDDGEGGLEHGRP